MAGTGQFRRHRLGTRIELWRIELRRQGDEVVPNPAAGKGDAWVRSVLQDQIRGTKPSADRRLAVIAKRGGWDADDSTNSSVHAASCSCNCKTAQRLLLEQAGSSEHWSAPRSDKAVSACIASL